MRGAHRRASRSCPVPSRTPTRHTHPLAHDRTGCAAQVCSRDDWLPRPFDPCAHVYYAATWCPAEEGEGEGNGGNSSARQLRIRYHVFYPWQAPCTELAVGAASEHQVR